MQKSKSRISVSDSKLAGLFNQLSDGHSGLSASEKEQITALCDHILNSGWHGEVACRRYLELCNSVGEQKSPADLWLLIGCQCRRFTSNNRVTLEYLHAVEILRDAHSAGLMTALKLMDALLEKIDITAPAALIDLFNTASHIFCAEEETAQWIVAAQRFSREPEHFQKFLELSRGSVSSLGAEFLKTTQARHKNNNCWLWLAKLKSADVAIAFLSVMPKFQKQLLESSLYFELLQVLSDDQISAIEFIKTAGLEWEVEHLHAILPFAIHLAEKDCESLHLLLACVKQQSLNLKGMNQWLESGLNLAVGNSDEDSEKNRLAMRAWFSLESLTSRNYLSDSLGVAHYQRCGPLLSLLTEGLAGEGFSLELIEGTEFNGAQLDTIDWQPDIYSRRIQLPIDIALTDDFQKNFSLYRLMILYQVCLWESGIAEVLSATDKKSLAYFVSEAEDVSLAMDIVNSCVPRYVEAFMVGRYPGIETDLAHWRQYYRRLLTAQKQAVDVDELYFSSLAPHRDFPVEGLQSLMSTISSNYKSLRRFSSSTLSVGGAASSSAISAVFYRGTLTMDLALLNLNMESLKADIDSLADDDPAKGFLDLLNPENVSIEKLQQGEMEKSMGQFLSDLEENLSEGEAEDSDLKKQAEELREKFSLEHGKAKKDAQIFTYNEWDYLIEDYRKDWCILHQHLLESKEGTFVSDTLSEHSALLTQIRKQLQMLKPELQRKVRGLLDGEDIHHDDAIEAVIDLKSGISPNENIYVQRLKMQRDVATLFLLDMSASTDESIEAFKASTEASEEAVEPEVEHSDYLMDPFDAVIAPPEVEDKVRIIDIARQSVVLMAEALEELADSYAISGFSGLGREQVDYFQCKAFDERYGREVKGRIESIAPRQSTRMGPAIRHGVAQLLKTESKVKAMIIISDGYPQDFDYGADRSSKVYGVEDTAKALQEAKSAGVLTFCLTVDPSGHDYLKAMCPDNQYMVINDIEELPRELSRVYSNLTS